MATHITFHPVSRHLSCPSFFSPAQVADLNALAELGKVYQESLSLSAQLRNLAALTVKEDKILGRGSLAVVSAGGLL
jgi:hypothetical protein